MKKDRLFAFLLELVLLFAVGVLVGQLVVGCRLLSPDGEPHAPGRVDRDMFGVTKTNSVTK